MICKFDVKDLLQLITYKGISRVSPAPVSVAHLQPAAPGSFIVGSESTFAEDAAGFSCQRLGGNQKIQWAFVVGIEGVIGLVDLKAT